MPDTTTPGAPPAPADGPQADSHVTAPDPFDTNAPTAAQTEPRSKRRMKTGAIVGGGAALLLAASAAGYLIIDNSDTRGYKLVPPATFNGLTQDNDNATARAMRNQDNPMQGAGSTIVITTYSAHVGDADPVLIVTGGYGGNYASPTLLTTPLIGLDSSPYLSHKTDENPGPLGGALQCGLFKSPHSTRPKPVCGWADGSTAAVVMGTSQADDSGPSLADLAATVRQLRAQMEVGK